MFALLRSIRRGGLSWRIFSMRALQGHTVTQWPQHDSPIVEPPSHSTRGLGSCQARARLFFQLRDGCDGRLHTCRFVSHESQKDAPKSDASPSGTGPGT